MTVIRALFYKDLMKFKLLLATWIGLLFLSAMTQTDWGVAGADPATYLQFNQPVAAGMLSLMKGAVLLLLLIPLLMMEDSRARPDSFLATRPLTAGQAALAKIMSAFAAGVILPALTDLTLMLIKGLPASKVIFVLPQLLITYGSVVLFAAMLACCLSSLSRYYGVLAFFAAALFPFTLFLQSLKYAWQFINGSEITLPYSASTELPAVLAKTVALQDSADCLARLFIMLASGALIFLAVRPRKAAEVIALGGGALLITLLLKVFWPFAWLPVPNFNVPALPADLQFEPVRQAQEALLDAQIRQAGFRAEPGADRLEISVPLAVEETGDLGWSLSGMEQAFIESTGAKSRSPVSYKRFFTAGPCLSTAGLEKLLERKLKAKVLVAPVTPCRQWLNFEVPRTAEVMAGPQKLTGKATFKAYAYLQQFDVPLADQQQHVNYPHSVKVKAGLNNEWQRGLCDKRLFNPEFDPARPVPAAGREFFVTLPSAPLLYLVYNEKERQVLPLVTTTEPRLRWNIFSPNIMEDELVEFWPDQSAAGFAVSREWLAQARLLAYRPFLIGTREEELTISISGIKARGAETLS